MFQKSLEIGYLLDFYGEMLNERRRTVLDMYYNEDMSLSEIADALLFLRYYRKYAVSSKIKHRQEAN